MEQNYLTVALCIVLAPAAVVWETTQPVYDAAGALACTRRRNDIITRCDGVDRHASMRPIMCKDGVGDKPEVSQCHRAEETEPRPWAVSTQIC